MKKFVLLFSFFTLLVSCQSKSGWIYEDISCDADIIPIVYKDDCTFLDIKKGDMAKNASLYDAASYFHEGIATVMKDDRYFFIDKHFNPINDKQYVEAGIFNCGIAWAVEDFGKITAINTKGKVLFELSNAEVAFPFREDISVFVSGDGKWGAVDKNGNIVIDPCYDELSICSYGGLLHAKIEDKYGIIDKTGKEIIPCKYEDLYFNSKTKYLGSVVVNNDDRQWGAVDLKDNWILQYSDRYWFLEADRDGMFHFYDRYCGWIDKKGKVVIPERYVKLDDVVNTGGPYDRGNTSLFGPNSVTVVAEDEDIFYLINKKGEKIADLPKIGWIDYSFDENGLMLFRSHLLGAFNTKGQIIIQNNYPDNILHLAGKIYLGERNGSIDVINEKGKVIKEIYGRYSLVDKERLSDHTVNNRYVDIDGIISDIDLILGENSMPNGITPGLVLAKYGLEDMGSKTVVASGEKPGFSYDFIVRRSYDYSSSSYYISSLELDLDLKGAADRNYEVRNSVYSKIKEYYSGNDNSREVLVPTFSDYQSTFREGTFTFKPNNTAWINGLWNADQIGIGDISAQLSIDCNTDWLINDYIKYYNDGGTVKYTIEDNTIKTSNNGVYYVFNYDEHALYYNGTVKMTKVGRIPLNISSPYISPEQ